MQTIRLAARALLALAALAPSQAALAQTAYTFTNVIDSTTYPGFTFLDDIAFDGDTVAMASLNRIFKVTGGVPTTIAMAGQSSPAGTITSLTGFLTLSQGNVAFVANTNSGKVVFRGSGGPLTKIARAGDMTPSGAIVSLAPILRAGINGDAVAFQADISPTISPGIFIGSGGPITTIRPPDGDITTSHTGPTLSGNRVVFSEFPGALGGPDSIYTSDGGPLTTIARVGDPSPAGPIGFTPASEFPEISGDVVAFRASVPGGQAIFTGNGGPLTTIVKTGDPAPGGDGVFTSVHEARVANNGQLVAFRGSVGDDDSSRTALFVSDNGVISKVIKSGDTMLGGTVFVGNMAALDRSGSGRVAFGYFRPGGISGIAIATPVPEPATAWLVACACIAVRFRRRL